MSKRMKNDTVNGTKDAKGQCASLIVDYHMGCTYSKTCLSAQDNPADVTASKSYLSVFLTVQHRLMWFTSEEFSGANTRPSRASISRAQTLIMLLQVWYETFFSQLRIYVAWVEEEIEFLPDCLFLIWDTLQLWDNTTACQILFLWQPFIFV